MLPKALLWFARESSNWDDVCAYFLGFFAGIYLQASPAGYCYVFLKCSWQNAFFQSGNVKRALWGLETQIY